MPESLGKILKRIRESKHLSIEEISERSRIPKHIVSIIEEDRLSEIESGFYAKTFVKTYAVFLGALGESGVKEYLAKTGREPQKKPEAALKPAIITRTSGIPKMDFSIIGRYKKQILAIIAGILVFWSLSFVVGQVSKFIKNMPARKQSKAVKRMPERQPARIPEKEKVVKEIKKEPSSEKPDSVELEVSASDNTWLKVIGDGELMFTGLFKKGSSDIWKAKKEIKLEAGNSGAIKIIVNGKPAGFSGKKGEKKEIIITKNGIK